MNMWSNGPACHVVSAWQVRRAKIAAREAIPPAHNAYEQIAHRLKIRPQRCNRWAFRGIGSAHVASDVVFRTKRFAFVICFARRQAYMRRNKRAAPLRHAKATRLGN
jgi:hypothetical protein